MGPPNQNQYYMTAFGGDDEAEEHLVLSGHTDSSQRSYLHSPIVEDDEFGATPRAQARGPAHQLSQRRVGREERERNEVVRSALYAEPLQDYEYSDAYYDQGSFTSLSKPYGRRDYGGDGNDDEQYRIMEKLDDSHLDREYVSRPSRGPSMYQRMRLMDEGGDEDDTALRRASTLLKRQLSKRRSGAPDGAVRRSLLANGASSESYGEGNIPLQELSGSERHSGPLPNDA
ncbi:hypothetical protein IWW55_005924, partial [Coemansia sp. RSA 2706]